MSHDDSFRDRRPREQARPGAPGPQGAGREPVDLLEIDAGDETDAAAREILEFESHSRLAAQIKVIGVGGGGGNALNTMIDGGLSGVEFVVANTDSQALQHNLAPLKIQLGAECTRGLGCGANPDKGRAAALEARDRLRDLLVGTDMVFVTAGLGGGTGTGAAPIVAEIAREVGALTVAVVTKPFPFEGKVRMKHAERGLDELHRVVDTLITIPNNRLLAIAGKTTAMKDAFRLADAVLLNAVRGISDLITVHGLINLDFADVRTIMSEMGMALMGTGVAFGETRAVDAARLAISSPLLEDLSIDGARGVLINITGGANMTLFEVNEAATLVQEAAHEEANIIFGAVVDETLGSDELRVTVIATGLDDGRMRRDRGRDRERGFEPAGYEDYASVTPLRREAGAEPAPAAGTLTTPPLATHAETAPAAALDYAGASEAPAAFVSPFEEDELDTPAFLRRSGDPAREGRRELTSFLRRGQEPETEEDREPPAFQRRLAD